MAEVGWRESILFSWLGRGKTTCSSRGKGKEASEQKASSLYMFDENKGPLLGRHTSTVRERRRSIELELSPTDVTIFPNYVCPSTCVKYQKGEAARSTDFFNIKASTQTSKASESFNNTRVFRDSWLKDEHCTIGGRTEDMKNYGQ